QVMTSQVSSVLRPLSKVVAVVTGGASGLGKATVETLARGGARVAILDLPQSNGAEVAASLGPNAIFTPANVSNDADVKSAFEQVKDKFGGCNAVVSCAGIAYAFKLYSNKNKAAAEMEKIERTINVNVLGTFNVIRRGSEVMMEAEKDQEDGQRGVFVLTASVAAYDGQIGQSAYSASKGAIVGMTLPLARDFADDSIRFVTIAPGLFGTPLLANLPSKVQNFLSSLVPNPKRLGNPDEYGALVQHVIQNSYLNGEIIRLDGALRMPP
ncbi:hypothetical protein PMAYCL1PPCAC_18522, partial [Pristionchus mayeri]